MMVEISRNQKEVYEILDKNFNLYCPNFKKIKSINDLSFINNVFCLSKKYYTKVDITNDHIKNTSTY